MKRRIRLTEAGLRRVIRNSIKRILKEDGPAGYVAPNDSTYVRNPAIGDPKQKQALDLFQRLQLKFRQIIPPMNIDQATAEKVLGRFIKDRRLLTVAVAIAATKIGALPMNTTSAYKLVCSKIGFDLIKFTPYLYKIARLFHIR